MKLLAFFLILTFFSKIVLNEDYYQLLGVQRDASNDQIRKAFKKLAMKYHPDKNKDNTEKAKEMFQKISNAYDILSNSTKRKIYDERGEEGIREHEAQSSQQQGGFFRMNPEEIFSHFFGGGGGFGGGFGGQSQGQQFTFNFGNGNGFFNNQGNENREEEDQRKNLFKDSPVENIDLSTISRFYRRQEIWVIFFMKVQPNQKIINIANELKKFASENQDVFRTAYVDCLKDEEVCEEFSVYDELKLKMFKQDSKSDPINLHETISAEEIKKKASELMLSFVENVYLDSEAEFLSRKKEKIHLLLFSDNKEPFLLYKYYSVFYKEAFSFGFIKSSEKELLKIHKIERLPSLIAIVDINNLEGEKFQEKIPGKFTKSDLESFLREYRNKKMFSKSFEPVQLNQKILDMGSCSSSDKNWCLIFAMKEKKDENIKKIKELSSSYIHENLDFYYIISSDEKDFLQSFIVLLTNEDNSIILINSLRQKYTVINDFVNLDIDAIKIKIDSILYGVGKFKPINLNHFVLKTK